MNLILPETYVKDVNGPLVFLAGPIKGGGMWQDSAIEFIYSTDTDLYIASPHQKQGKYKRDSMQSDQSFETQLQWERHYLRQAARNGAILFWLPKESGHSRDYIYAETTRRELGEWTTRYQLEDGIRLVIGGEEEFSGFDNIRRNLAEDCPNLSIYSTLEGTCKEAVRLSRLK